MVWRNPDQPFALRAADYRREHGGTVAEARQAVARFDDENHPDRGLARDEMGNVIRRGPGRQPVHRSAAPPGGGGDSGGGSDGDGSDGGGGTPSADNLAALIPGLPDNIASLYADLWAEHGNGDVALAHLRQTSEHRRAFPGFRREDGSLRFDNEQIYMAQIQGFKLALNEFGLDPGGVDLVGLIENEVDAEELAGQLGQVVDTFTAPGAEPPRSLVQQFVNEFTSTGSRQEAMERVRDSEEYQRIFPGIRRDDGSLVMDERSYFAHREGMRRTFQQWGLNPKLFEGHHAELIQGEVSLDELDARVQAKVEGVMQNIGQVRERFGSFYGIESMDDNALIAAAIDPEIGMGLLQGRITAAQVSGEAAMAGFDRGRARSERLAQAGGLGQQQARQLFSQAARAVPRFDRFGRRFRGGEFDVEDFEEASVFGDAEQQRRMGRLEASEQALFRRGGQLRRDERGFQGLRRR